MFEILNALAMHAAIQAMLSLYLMAYLMNSGDGVSHTMPTDESSGESKVSWGHINSSMKDLMREDFLQQNGFTDYDFMYPLGKTIGMMRVIVRFHEMSQKAIAESSVSSVVYSAS